jgi:hypothetical protein
MAQGDSHSRPTPVIVRGVLSVSVSSLFGLCGTPLTASGDQAHSSPVLVRPVWLGNPESKPIHSR